MNNWNDNSPAGPRSNDSLRLLHLLAYLAISGLLSLALWMLLLLPIHLEAYNWSSQRIGWAIGTYFLVQLVFQILGGHIADRWGNVPTALVGAGLATLGAIFYLLSLLNPWFVFPARGLHGAGAALVFSGALIQLVQSVPEELRGRMIGYFGLPGFVMLGAGPFIAEWLILEGGYGACFSAILVLFVIIAWILSRLPRPLVPDRHRRERFLPAFTTVFSRLGKILVLSIAFGLTFSCWHAFVAPALMALGPGVVSSFGLGYAMGAVLTRIGVSHYLERGRLRLLGISTLIFYGAGVGFIPLLSETWALVVTGAVLGMSHGVYYPSLSSLAAERFHPLHTGKAMALYVSASNLGMFVGPPIWGRLADRFDYPPVFAAAGVLLAVATLFYLVSERKSAQETSSSRILKTQ